MHDIYKLFQLSEISNVYLDLHQYPEAILMGQKCLSLSKRLKNNDLQINACKMLADAYSRIGDRDSSDKYRMQYYVLNDKIYNLKKYFSLKNSLLQYENMQVDRHINHLELTIIFVSLIVLSLVILVVVIIKKNRSLRDAQKMLIRKNNELQKSESKSNELMKKYIPDAVIPDHNEQKEVQPGENTPILNEEQSEHLLRLIISAMENNDAVFNPDFNLNTLAVMVNSNTKYVSMVINDTYQKNFKTLLNEYRIREACKRLTDTEHYGNMTIQAIYEEVGYRNAVNFIRVFKKVMGMTPSVYQRLSQEKDEDR
jgi:YesN/AraC family two-component response regulator